MNKNAKDSLQNIEPRFLEILRSQNSINLYSQEAIPIRAMYDSHNSILHFQTDPFFDGTSLVVKRLASYVVRIETYE